MGHSVCPYRYVDVDHPTCSVSFCFNYQCLLFRFVCSFIFMQYSLSLEVHSILLLGLHSGHLFLTAALVLLFKFVPFFVLHMLVFCGIILPIYMYIPYQFLHLQSCSRYSEWPLLVQIFHLTHNYNVYFLCALSDSKCHAYVIV